MKFTLIYIYLMTTFAYASQIKISTDNDLFSSNDDRDYTASFSFSYISQPKQFKSKKLEFGLLMFTPEDIKSHIIQVNDRPYASLIYTSFAQSKWKKNSVLSHSLTIGLLGLSTPGKIQNLIHKNIGSTPANGWSNQISNNGEITGLYSFNQTFNYSPIKTVNFININYGYSLNLGYLSQVSTQFNLKIGYFNSFFNESGLNNGNIASENTVPIRRKSKEYFLYFGFTPKLVLYNSFLQGQVRKSLYTLSSKNVKRFVTEAWVGSHISISNNLYMNLIYKFQTKETQLSKRNFNWGSISLNYIL